MNRLAVLAVLALLSEPGCGTPSVPDAPSPSPSPTATPLPAAIPNATILQNLDLIRQVERASRRDSLLVFLAGSSDAQGIVTGVWRYQFADPPLYTLHEWDVSRTGFIEYLGERTDALHLSMIEIQPFVTLDSSEAIERAALHGGADYLDRYPDSVILFAGRYIGGRAVWEMNFDSRSHDCGFGVVIDARTAELLWRSDRCP